MKTEENWNAYIAMLVFITLLTERDLLIHPNHLITLLGTLSSGAVPYLRTHVLLSCHLQHSC